MTMLDGDRVATLGVILAGGKARRMGGGDKALIDLCGQKLLDHVRGRLLPQVGDILLSANGDLSRFGWPSGHVVADRSEFFGRGPLSGVLAAMESELAAGARYGFLLVVPCDTPLLPPDLSARLHEARRARGVLGALASSGGRRHPTIALWSLDLRVAVRGVVAGRDVRLDEVTRDLGFAEACWPIAGGDPFLNLNEAKDLSAAVRILSGA